VHSINVRGFASMPVTTAVRDGGGS
jgi:hypothetical protein